jgi:hypothetical protein
MHWLGLRDVPDGMGQSFFSSVWLGGARDGVIFCSGIFLKYVDSSVPLNRVDEAIPCGRRCTPSLHCLVQAWSKGGAQARGSSKLKASGGEEMFGAYAAHWASADDKRSGSNYLLWPHENSGGAG